MDILFKLHGNLKSSSVGYTSSGRTPQSPASTVFGKEDRMNEIRSKAKALVMFANMIQFRMDPNTITQLLRLEVFMS